MLKSTLDARLARARVRQLLAMVLVYAIFYVCRLAFSASKKGMIEVGAYTPTELGYVGSAMLFAYAIGKLVNGFIADRISVKRFIMFGLSVSVAVNLLVGFHLPALVLAAVWFVNGYVQAIGAPCCAVALSRWWPKDRRGTIYGFWACSNNLGEVFAYILSALLVVAVGCLYGPVWAWKSCFWGASAVGLIGIAIAKFCFGDSPEGEGLPAVPRDKDELACDTSAGQRIAMKSPLVWMVALAGGFFAASRYAIIDWGLFFLQVKKGYDATSAATIISLNSIVGVISSVFSGYVSDRFFRSSRFGLAITSGVLVVVSLSVFMLVPVHCLWVDMMSMVAFGFAAGILLAFLGGLMAVDFVPPCAVGVAMGIAGMGNYIGAGLQSIVSGYLVSRAADGSATLVSWTFSNGYSIDVLAVFWIGVSVLTVLCILVAWYVSSARGTSAIAISDKGDKAQLKQERFVIK